MKIKTIALTSAALLLGAANSSAATEVDSVPSLPTLSIAPQKQTEALQLKTPEYKFKNELTYSGVPLFLAGIIAKSEKKSFRQNYDNEHSRTRLLTNFHTEIDNYTQFAPIALAAGLNFAGVEGRSKPMRFVANSALSYAVMAVFVNGIKYTAKEMRPDGSTANSWPSGHTATAFTSATILHKEYGLTRSPWYSVAGYSVATATGIMRVLNNRHWVSDVLSGAGIGILSTELAYGIGDLLFKEKGNRRGELANTADLINHPSFFNVSMGIGLGNRDLDFSGEDLLLFDPNSTSEYGEYYNPHLKFSASTAVAVEGAYFINKYIGFGGRFRVLSSPIKGFDEANKILETKMLQDQDYYIKFGGPWKDVTRTINLTIESDHITEFSADAGIYLNLPLSNRFALDTKFLVGRSIIQDLDINGHIEGTKVVATDDEYMNHIYHSGKEYSTDWDYLTVGGNNTTKVGTGLSLTYAYKQNFSWKVYADYDYTRKNMEMSYDPNTYFIAAVEIPLVNKALEGFEPFTTYAKKDFHSFVLGAAFQINF